MVLAGSCSKQGARDRHCHQVWSDTSPGHEKLQQWLGINQKKMALEKKKICNSIFGELTSSERAQGWLGEEERLLGLVVIHRSTVPCQGSSTNISPTNASEAERAAVLLGEGRNIPDLRGA